MSPLHEMDFENLGLFLDTKMSKQESALVLGDLRKIQIRSNILKCEVITIAGEREGIDAEHIIPNGKHYLSNPYLKKVVEFL